MEQIVGSAAKVRHRHVRRQAAALRTQDAGHRGSDRRTALDLVIGGVESRSLVTGQHPMVALGVVAGPVVDRPHDGQPIHPTRLLGQELAEVDAR
jgi:hypothetical protein